jgi:glycosyltransferase involved in cell wall biosynthesis
MNIVFWQNSPSHHQNGAINRLAEVWPDKVLAVFDVKIRSQRKMLGWQYPDIRDISVHFLDEFESPEAFVKRFCKQHRDAIHILGGFRGCESVRLAWKYLRQRTNTKLVCLSERPHFRGFKSILQYPWYWAFIHRHKLRFKAILAMGSQGVECFERLGASPNQLFCYMYQLDFKAPVITKFNKNHHPPVRFVYAGQMIHRKGVDILVDAMRELHGEWNLDFIGSTGALEEKVLKAANETDGGNVRYLGNIPSNEIVSTLSGYDVCLVPSRHDGWGMVTNEALLAGIGVLVSDSTGSKDLVDVSGAGAVFKHGNVSALVNAMQRVIDHPEILDVWKERACAFQSYISSDAVGDYLAGVLKFVFLGEGLRPQPPWLSHR